MFYLWIWDLWHASEIRPNAISQLIQIMSPINENDLYLYYYLEETTKEDDWGRSQCAWCGKDQGPKPGVPKGKVSHGICDECLEKELEEI